MQAKMQRYQPLLPENVLEQFKAGSGKVEQWVKCQNCGRQDTEEEKEEEDKLLSKRAGSARPRCVCSKSVDKTPIPPTSPPACLAPSAPSYHTLPECSIPATGATGPPRYQPDLFHPGCAPSKPASPVPLVACYKPNLAPLFTANNMLDITDPQLFPGEPWQHHHHSSHPTYSPLPPTPPRHYFPSSTNQNHSADEVYIYAVASLAKKLHEDEVLAMCKVDEKEEQQRQCLVKQEQQLVQQESEQEQQHSVSKEDVPDILALMGTPAEVYEAQYGRSNNSSEAPPSPGQSSHLLIPAATAAQRAPSTPSYTVAIHTHISPSEHTTPAQANADVSANSGCSEDAMIAALMGNLSDACQYLYGASGVQHNSGTDKVGDACQLAPKADTSARLGSPAAASYTQARPHALDLSVSEEELQQAIEAEELLFSKAPTSSNLPSPTDGYKEELKGLKLFFPSISELELLGVLDAFQGDMMAANDFLIEQLDEAARLKLQQADQDAELARSMHEKEEQEQGTKRDGLKLSDSELTAGVLNVEDAADVQLMHDLGRTSGKRGKGSKAKGGGGSTALSPSPLNGVQQGSSTSNEVDAWRERSVKQFTGAALQHSSAALAGLELGQAATGNGGSGGMLVPGVYADPEQEKAVWQEVEANRNTRRVAILTRWFGTKVDRGLLTDVVNSCGGNLEQAREQLRAVGLQEVYQSVEQQPEQPLAHKPPSPMGLATKRQSQQRGSNSGVPSPLLDHNQFYTAVAGAPYGLAAAARQHKTAGATAVNGVRAGEEEDVSSESGSLDERCAAEEGEVDMDAAFKREWEAMLAEGTTPNKDVLHTRTEAMYRMQRAEADRLHALRRSAQAAAQRAGRKGQAHKALEKWEHVEHLKAKCLAASTLAAEKLHAWRNATRVSYLEWDFHCLHVEEALPMMRRNIEAAAVLPGRKEVRLITGRGVHSDREPKLPSAVRNWLSDHNITFHENVGYFIIMLDPVNPISVAVG